MVWEVVIKAANIIVLMTRFNTEVSGKGQLTSMPQSGKSMGRWLCRDRAEEGEG